jgi:hypothetical protein
LTVPARTSNHSTFINVHAQSCQYLLTGCSAAGITCNTVRCEIQLQQQKK